MDAALVCILAAILAFWLGWLVHARVARRRFVAKDREDRQHLDLVLWSTGDELWDVDLARDEFIRRNPLRQFEATRDELVSKGSEMRNDLRPEDRAEFDRGMIAHLKGETEFVDVVYRARALSGQWRWLRTRGRVIRRDPSSGRALRMLGTTSDVTDFKNYQSELESLNQTLESRVQQRTEALHRTNLELRATIDDLKRAQQQLVHAEKLAALGGLVAGVAHEINTPLGISVTAASYLEQQARLMGAQLDAGGLTREGLQQFQQTAAESSQMILRNLMRADRLVKSFKQVAVDQSSERKRAIDLGDYLREVMSSLHPELKRTPYVVEIDCPSGLALNTYPGAIFQITANLVMNALLHAFAGRESGTLSIIGRSESGAATIVYQDNGVGMDDEIRTQIFNPFFTTRRGAGGSGLGLHIVWNLATQVLGGSITCESARGQGSRFELRFPSG